MLCGRDWAHGMNRCECGGMCSWGIKKGGKPSSWIVNPDGSWIPKPPPERNNENTKSNM